MNKLINKINGIKINKYSILISLLALFFSSIIFAIPFIHSFTIRTFALLAILTICCGILIGGIIFCSILIFYKTQAFLIDVTFSKFLVQICLIYSVELIALSIVSFVLMLYPPLFLIVGAICFLFVCGFNIVAMYKMFCNNTISTQSLLKGVKIYNISILAITVCLWYIV